MSKHLTEGRLNELEPVFFWGFPSAAIVNEDKKRGGGSSLASRP
jgi:hypothetical protein